MSEQLQIPVELPVKAVKDYVMGETLTPYNFDLLQNYFEGRIIKLLESRKQHPALVEIDPSARVMNMHIDLMIELIKISGHQE